MEIKITKKKIFGTIGFLVLGVMSTEFSNLIHPVIRWCKNLTLNLISFGIDTLKDGIYQGIAKNYHEALSLSLLELVLLCISAIPLSLLVTITIRRYSPSVDKVLSKISINKDKMRPTIFVYFYFVFFVGLTLGVCIKNNYINRSVSYYNQFISIASPYITNEEKLKFNSQFSLIKNQNDYNKIIDELKTITDKYSINFTDFKDY